MRVYHGKRIITGAAALLLIVLLSLLTRALLAAEQSLTKDPTHLPDDLKFPEIVMVMTADPFWQTNCYIISGKNHEALLIDPSDEIVQDKVHLLVDPATGKSVMATPEQEAHIEGDTYTDPATHKEYRVYAHYHTTGKDIQKIYDVLQQHKLVCKYIVVSHGHIDHIAGLKFLKEKTGAKILMNRIDTRAADGGMLPPEKPGEHIDAYPKDSYTIEGGEPKVDQFLRDGDLIRLDDNRIVLQVMSTPGHSPGSISLRTHYKDVPIIFDGDTLFYHTIGRTNFRDGSGDHALLLRTIRDKILSLPDDTVIFPGHYQYTTVAEEKRYHTLDLLKDAL